MNLSFVFHQLMMSGFVQIGKNIIFMEICLIIGMEIYLIVQPTIMALLTTVSSSNIIPNMNDQFSVSFSKNDIPTIPVHKTIVVDTDSSSSGLPNQFKKELTSKCTTTFQKSVQILSLKITNSRNFTNRIFL